MEELERKFEGVWIPKELWLSTELTLQEKVMIVEINSLDNKEGCYASNEYFAKFFNLSKARVSQIINDLSKKEIIDIEYIYKGKEVDKRIIHINQEYLIGIKYPKGSIKYPKCNNINNNIENINTINSINSENLENPKKKISKKQQNYIDIYNMLEDFTTNERVKDALKKYLKVRTTERSLNVEQWSIILANLRDECGIDSKYALQLIEQATACGWMQIVYAKKFNGKAKTSYGSKPTFDNTAGHVQVYHISDEEFNKLSFEEKLKEMEKFDAVADMTPLQKEFHSKYCLARDNNGNLLKF